MMESLNLSKKRRVTEATEEVVEERPDWQSLITPDQRLFISAIRSKSEEDLIKCIPIISESVDLMFAMLFCVMFKWREA